MTTRPFTLFTIASSLGEPVYASDTYNEFGILSTTREKEEKLALQEYLDLIGPDLVAAHPEKVEKAYKIGLSPGFVKHSLNTDLEICPPGTMPARALNFLVAEEEGVAEERRERKKKEKATSFEHLIASMTGAQVENILEQVLRRHDEV